MSLVAQKFPFKDDNGRRKKNIIKNNPYKHQRSSRWGQFSTEAKTLTFPGTWLISSPSLRPRHRAPNVSTAGFKFPSGVPFESVSVLWAGTSSALIPDEAPGPTAALARGRRS